MELLLKELGLASKLLTDFKDMYEYENRLKTFSNWPFIENCKCTPENMAKAGFVHCPNANEPDVAKCFFCLIELEGWEPNDDPWEEHIKRHNCGFLSLTKHFDDLTVEEYYMLEMTRLRTFLILKENLFPSEMFSQQLITAEKNTFGAIINQSRKLYNKQLYLSQEGRPTQCKTGRSIINSFEEEVTATRQRLVDNFISKHQYRPPLPEPLHADPSAQHSESSYCQSKKKIQK